DQRVEGALEVRAGPLVDRVHLDEADHPLDEQLAEGVERRYARDVAGAEDERDASLRIALLIEGGLPADRRLAVDPLLHEDAAAEAGVEQLLDPGGREQVDLEPAVAALPAAHAERRPAAGGDRLERLDHEPGAAHGDRRAGQP